MDSLPPPDHSGHHSTLPSRSETGSPKWLSPEFMVRRATPSLEWEWTSQTPITQRQRETAAGWLRAHQAMINPPPSRSIEDWLVALGLQCASQMPGDEARMRAAAYVSTFAERPSYWFTKGTLRAAAEHFKWFPAVAEIVEFLKKATQDKAAQVEGARRIVNGPAQPAATVHVMEPLGVRLKAIAESFTRHYGADDPRAIKARKASEDHDAA